MCWLCSAWRSCSRCCKLKQKKSKKKNYFVLLLQLISFLLHTLGFHFFGTFHFSQFGLLKTPKWCVFLLEKIKKFYLVLFHCCFVSRIFVLLFVPELSRHLFQIRSLWIEMNGCFSEKSGSNPVPCARVPALIKLAPLALLIFPIIKSSYKKKNEL